ncbi:tail fiber assembly protein [Enterobacter roggenkampii]|uniref:tail fiber assembly protein n=1 Tax=Enterobacter roggenkampii TaxID=1812935 RepID=UPI001E373541|nr:tail fiber assembly protein [Enterobacter roggenkampii]MCC7577995.1 tail fiber assembly protein [Enterobacter roggenkampii]MCC7586859.1 tail fiber assembly protein [Enterobacter roggenkampii]MCC7591919.1 tail fiber assembly protein [Enterobacter roggenkampii]MCC7601487.1 tail fiber assembly protein [Enterobacter roggenkampii]MCC7606087.1 tail fiber assembly protein [Enterobacter roggenkampii]
MGNYALVKDGQVINTIIWDGPQEAPIEFGGGIIAIEITSNEVASIGYSYSEGKFIAPPLTEEEKAQIKDAAQQSNLSSKGYLMKEASQRISVLQDAVDLDMATEDEAAALALWKKYRVLLSRVDSNTAKEINWPEKPSF